MPIVWSASAGSSVPERHRESAIGRIETWFKRRDWDPFPFQREAWNASRSGRSGLIHVATGAGKTYAALMGPLSRMIDDLESRFPKLGLQLLYITPIKALSRDIESAILSTVNDLGLPFSVETRTGDTSAHRKARQKNRLPSVLITTPESLTLLLSHPESTRTFRNLHSIVVDEWHELLGTKRGVQLELALSRLRAMTPGISTWALTATLSHLEEAARAVAGTQTSSPPVILRSADFPPPLLRTLLPSGGAPPLPWAGRLGLSRLEDLLRELDPAQSTLIFTNTRFQAERWYREILETKPDFESILAIHHGSLDAAERERVERGLKAGSLKWVVATSSLDLGVDFGPVEKVLQIGSPKSIARVLQRAGRSGHRPGARSELVFVPTQSLELLEIDAVRRAILEKIIEPRPTLSAPLDVLTQHLVNCAAGPGFRPDELFEEVRGTWSYRALTRKEFDWVLKLVTEGGDLLGAYPEYHRVVLRHGRCEITDRRMAQLHRMNLGTLGSNSEIEVKFQRGKRLGTLEENYASRLKTGDRFIFAGRVLEVVRLAENSLHVKLSSGPLTQAPRWSGGRLPLSSTLSEALRSSMAAASAEGEGQAAGFSAEIKCLQPLLHLQAKLSHLPGAQELLAETCTTREGFHLFLYPFEGRLVHEGLASLLAYRIGKQSPTTFSLAANDYGIEFVSSDPLPYALLLGPLLFNPEHLDRDIQSSLNLGELSKRQFRDIARISGLVFRQYPGRFKSLRQVQSSASLLFDVFTDHDPGNLLLEQAKREVLEQNFERIRLQATLARMKASTLIVRAVQRPTPFGFPLMLERLSTRLSTETLASRIEKMKAHWTAAS